MTMVKLSMLALSSALLLAGCAVEFQNAQPAQEVARLSKPPGSVYIGWRVFQDRCASCHGAAAAGGAGAPNLLPLVRDMGSRQFVSLVLKRYDWGLPPAQARGDSAAQAALVETIVQRREEPLTMPAWQGEPRVQAHIADLYAYLSARAGYAGAGSSGTVVPRCSLFPTDAWELVVERIVPARGLPCPWPVLPR